MKILIFIESLYSGGKERRLVELLSGLKDNPSYEFLVVLTRDEIHYKKFLNLKIPYVKIKRKFLNKDPRIFYKIYKISKDFKPDIIHVWGGMTAFYSLPTKIFQRIPLINSQIADAPVKIKRCSFPNFINQINFLFSDNILANSFAGLQSYKVNNLKKSSVIVNGINLNRFLNLENTETIKKQYKISTPFTIIMVASFNSNKDYDLFNKIAIHISKIRNDISFIGAGSFIKSDHEFKRISELARNYSNIIYPGRIKNVEELVNACDIGVLFSPNGEGISNSIMEYMALSKPVIASCTGGTPEIMIHNTTGYLINNESVEEISQLILNLIDNKTLRISMGKEGEKRIKEDFSLKKMSQEFEKIYQKFEKK